jgi:hypothetical protein
MTFEAGAWIAGGLGALAGVAATRLSALPLAGRAGWVDALMGALVGSILALLAYGVLSMFEAWAAFFQRTATPVVPLLFTAGMLAAWLTTLWLVRRRRKP